VPASSRASGALPYPAGICWRFRTPRLTPGRGEDHQSPQTRAESVKSHQQVLYVRLTSDRAVDNFLIGFLLEVQILLVSFTNVGPECEELGEGGNLYTSATMSGIGNKRTAGEPGPSAPPEKKAGVEDSGTTVETIKLGGVSSTEELDIRTLQTKNRKLAEMLDQRQAIEDELREHIEKLERRQATDDASLLIINRYWNQVGNS
ncbi:hypothetical protein EK904_006637, partial [Melospiza melodia maxima]